MSPIQFINTISSTLTSDNIPRTYLQAEQQRAAQAEVDGPGEHGHLVEAVCWAAGVRLDRLDQRVLAGGLDQAEQQDPDVPVQARLHHQGAHHGREHGQKDAEDRVGHTLVLEQDVGITGANICTEIIFFDAS